MRLRSTEKTAAKPKRLLEYTLCCFMKTRQVKIDMMMKTPAARECELVSEGPLSKHLDTQGGGTLDLPGIVRS
jgi:hypothetical protein